MLKNILENLHVIDFILIISTLLFTIILSIRLKYILHLKVNVRASEHKEILKSNNELDELIEHIRLKKININNKDLSRALDLYFEKYNDNSPQPLNQIRSLEKKKLLIIYKYFLSRQLDKSELKTFEKELEKEYDKSIQLVEKLRETVAVV